MQVQMDAVKSHVSRTRNAHDRVQIRSVVVAKSSSFMNDAGNSEDILIKDSEGIRIRQHQSGRMFAAYFCQLFKINASVFRRRDIDDLEAAHG